MSTTETLPTATVHHHHHSYSSKENVSKIEMSSIHTIASDTAAPTSSTSTSGVEGGTTSLSSSIITKNKEDTNNNNDNESTSQKIKRIAKDLFIRYWFLLGLGIAIGLAWAFPQVGKRYGSIQAQYTVKWGAVILIFLLSGLGLEVSVMLKTILRWKLHLVTQIISFIVLPFVMYGICRFLIAVHANIDASVYKGWIIALSTSTTVSSNAIMTRNANGNDGAALFNAALGNVLGIFLSPALMTIFEKDSVLFQPGTAKGTPDYVSVLKNLGSTVLAPLVVGQFIRYLFPQRVKYIAQKCRFSIINSLALLCLVWSVFCDGVASNAFKNMSGVDIVAIIFIDISMYLFGCLTCLTIARLPWPSKLVKEPKWVNKCRFSRKDSIAIMYCGATKTVSMGIPLINVLYSTSSYDVIGVLSLPLLMYHICQLFIGNFQVPLLKKWAEKDEENLEESSEILPNNTVQLTTMRRRG